MTERVHSVLEEAHLVAAPARGGDGKPQARALATTLRFPRLCMRIGRPVQPGSVTGYHNAVHVAP